MALSPISPFGDELFVRYLLGLLSEEEAERVDELSIADDDVAWRLRAAEDDLVDAYVRGTLSGATLSQFERVYLATPRRREKVEFARSLQAALDRIPKLAASMAPAVSLASATSMASAGPAARAAGTATAVTVAPVRWYERLGLVPRSSLGWTLATVGALLAIVCGALLIQTVRLREDLTTAETERAALDSRARDLERQVNDQRAASASLSKEMDRLRGQLSTASQTATPQTAAPQNGPPQNAGGQNALATPRPSSSSPGVLAMAALLLSPQTRSAAPVPALAVRPGTEGVGLVLLLEASDFPRYQVVLKDPATNAVLWRSDKLAAASISQAPAVSVVIPARLLKTQHYALDLVGLRPGDGSDVIGSYAFRIVQ